MKVYQKLNAARKEFHTLQLKKTGLNKFAGYSYFELGDFLIPALNVFDKHGLCAFISFGQDLATMQIVCADTGESIAITSPMAEAQLKGCHPIQNLGAVETYQRRYLWVSALEIVEHDALDSSKPLETGLKEVKKQGALQGIGDDLPEQAKEALKDLAAEAVELVNQGNPEGALNVIKAFGLQGDENIYLDRQLPSNVRSALRKVNQQKVA